jgi:pimeloyl-ACP methyl ester carboxylesterase
MVFDDLYLNYNVKSYKTIYHNDKYIKYNTYGDINNKSILLICGLGKEMSLFEDNSFVSVLVDKGYHVICFDNTNGFNFTSKTKYSITFIKLIIQLNYINNLLKVNLNYNPLNILINISDIYSFDYTCENIMHLLNHLSIKKIELLGHSMGGMIIQEFFIKYPQYVSKMTLISSSYGPGMCEHLPDLYSIYNFFRTSNKKNEVYNKYVKNIQTLAIIYQENRLNKLCSINKKYSDSIPLIIIHGKQDTLIPVLNSVSMFSSCKKVFKFCDLIIFDDICHSLDAEYSERILQKIFINP